MARSRRRSPERAWSSPSSRPTARHLRRRGAQNAVAPASLQKLIVAATALRRLGSAYRYHTISRPQGIGDNGVLDGNLWLVGSGDPSLLPRFARGRRACWRTPACVDRGRRRRRRDRAERTASAILIGVATTTVRITPRRSTRFPSTATRSNRTKIVGGVEQAVLDADAGRGAIRRQRYAAYACCATASPRPRRRAWRRAARVGRVVGSSLRAAARPGSAHAVRFRQSLCGAAAANARRRSQRHRPTTPAASRPSARFLSERGIPNPGLRLVDGSGLSAGNRVAAITLARILLRRCAAATSLYLLLPQGGRQGTLRRLRFHDRARARAREERASQRRFVAGRIRRRPSITAASSSPS